MMMKRRFTTITTILAGALAGNTAFFATQAIATQEMQPTAQVADQSESSVLEETLPYYLSLSSIDVTKVAYFDKLDGWRVVCPKLILILPVH